MFTSEQLDALQAAAEAATPGPWEAEVDDGEGTTGVNASSALTTWTEYEDGLRIGSPARSWRTTDRIVERDDLYDEDFEQAAADAEFIAAANPAVILEFIAEYRRIHAELERSKRGGKTLGEMIKQQCDDIVKITDSAHLIDETGDGDWGAVWERGFDMRAQRDAALARIARVEALHERIGASWPHNGGVYVCRADGGIWPCPTVRALTEGELDAAIDH